jgi:methionyl-tRNA formyltransferase
VQLSIASSSLVSLPVIEAILASEHTIGSIITNPDKETGRGQKVVPNELAAWAESKGLNVAKPADTSELNRHLLDAQPQLIVTVAYGRIIPVELLHGPRFGWINLHFSLLPAYRGAAPVQWALLNGDTRTGFTIFKLDKGMDTGPIYIQEELDISPTDTTDSLLHTLGQRGATSIIELLAVIGKTRTTPQATAGISLAPKISKEMGKIDWKSSADQILRTARALEARPGLYTNFQGEKISLFGLTESLTTNSLVSVGSIEATSQGLLVRCSDSVLLIEEVTPAGKKRMKAADFARGAHLTSESRFE